MDADLNPERLKQFIDIADPTWVKDQLVKYEAFRRSHSPKNNWSHRPPSMSPVIPLIYWSSREPYEPTNEPYMGYWSGEPKSILGRFVTHILVFKDYWGKLPDDIGLKNMRWFIKKPSRFASFEHEIRTADVYKFRTPYEVEPCFLNPRSKKGEPDIILRKGTKIFNVQCKCMDPSTSSSMSYELFRYLLGCLGRISQDCDIHSYLTVNINKDIESSITRKDVDSILVRLRELLKKNLSVVGIQPFSGGNFTFHHEPSRNRRPSHLSDQFTMWSKGYLFQERRTVFSKVFKTYKITTVCQVTGGVFPSFESYVYPRFEEAAREGPRNIPLIICLHLYPPVPVYNYRWDHQVQKKVIPDINKFFDRNRHVCLLLISSNAQMALPVSVKEQMVLTPAWEIESPSWSGERPTITHQYRISNSRGFSLVPRT